VADAVNDWLHARGVLDADVDANYVGKLERGLHRWPGNERRRAFRAVFDAPTDHSLGFYIIRDTRADTSAPAPVLNRPLMASPAWSNQLPDPPKPPGTAVATIAERPGDRQAHPATLPIDAHAMADLLRSDVDAPPGTRVELGAPAGRYFSDATIPAQIRPAIVEHGRVHIGIPTDVAVHLFLRRPRRALVIGRADGADRPHLYGLDSRHALRRLAGLPDGARLLLPSAYRLDELTLAVLWAVANLDEALLADDGLIEEHRGDVAGYQAMTRSSVGRDLAADLTDVGRMWLGSMFCAQHIQRHCGALRDVPIFWTREQRGEEASAWLLFTHKHDYLRVTAAHFAGGPGLRRIFCIPDTAVEPSPPGERMLLLLAAALMESYGIEAVVTTEPEHANVPGFAADQHRRAIVASWVGADGIWHVDVTDHRPLVTEYLDAAGDATAQALTRAAEAGRRLYALADYLGLDWPLMRQRCRELADHGLAGIAQPRSRHLSTAGVDRACRYLATLPVDG
jgi:hypothetical protein